MRSPWTQFALGLIFCVAGSCGAGCSGTPDEQTTFSVPSFGGVPEQWEPEVTASEIDESGLNF